MKRFFAILIFLLTIIIFQASADFWKDLRKSGDNRKKADTLENQVVQLQQENQQLKDKLQQLNFIDLLSCTEHSAYIKADYLTSGKKEQGISVIVELKKPKIFNYATAFNIKGEQLSGKITFYNILTSDTEIIILPVTIQNDVKLKVTDKIILTLYESPTQIKMYGPKQD